MMLAFIDHAELEFFAISWAVQPTIHRHAINMTFRFFIGMPIAHTARAKNKGSVQAQGDRDMTRPAVVSLSLIHI